MAEDAVILLPEGTPIGEWRVVKPHRIGGSSTVYRVRRDGTSGPDYALKLRNRGTAVCTREEFQRELRILRDRKLGVNQPAFLGCGEFEGEPYFVMEFAEMIRPGMNPDETYWFFRGIAEGLLRLNTEFLFHGDIKDVNLGICGAFPKRRPVLLDFGSVRPWVRNLKDPLATTESMLHEDVKETGLYTFLDDLRALAQVMQKYCNDEARARYSEAIEGALRKNESATYTSTKDFIAALDACHRKNFKRKIVILSVLAFAIALVGIFSLSSWNYRTRVDSVRHQVKEKASFESLVEIVHSLYDNPRTRDASKAIHYCKKALCGNEVLDDRDRGYIHGVMAECLIKAHGDAEDVAKALEHANAGKSFGDARAEKVLGIITRMHPDLKAP